MHIYLYNNKAENNRVDKTDYLEPIIEIEGQLKYSTSIVNPDIIIDERTNAKRYVKANSLNVYANNSRVSYSYKFGYEDLIKANYMYIPELNRYYFIIDIVSVNANLWELACKCDVISTYKNELLKLEGFVERNEYTFDRKIPDNLISFENERKITTHIIPKLKHLGYDYNSGVTVVTLFTESDGTVPVSYADPNIQTNILKRVYTYGTGYGTNAKSYVLKTLNDLENLISSVIDKEQIASSIFNITSYPFKLEDIGVDAEAVLIDEINGESLEYPFEAYPISNNIPPYFKIAEFTLPKLHNDEWLNFPPYTKYQLYIPYVNTIDIDYDLCRDRLLTLYYIPNYLNGNTSYILINDKDQIVSQGMSSMGISIPINSANNQAIRDNIATSATSMGTGVIGSTLMATIGATLIATGVGTPAGVSMLASAGVTAMTSIASNTVNITNQHTIYNLATPSGVSGAYSSQELILYISTQQPTITTDNSRYLKLVGKPLKKIRPLEILKGFTVISALHLENLPATSQEKEEIEKKLIAGIIL